MLTKVHIIKSMIFPVVMYRCKGLTIKKVGHQRTDDFVLWYWRRFLTVPWTGRISNQSILQGINPEYPLEGLMPRASLLAQSSKEHACSAADTRDVGLIPGPRRSGKGNDNPLHYSCLENPMDRRAWWATVHGVAKSQTQLSNWTTTTDAEVEAPVFWPPDAKSWFIGKDLNAGKEWGQEEKGATEDKIVGWHHQLNGHKFEDSLGDSEWQGRLVCCSPWGCKESDTTEQQGG